MDHAEAVVAVMHVGPALDQLLGGVLGLVEFSGVDESDRRIGRDVDLGIQAKSALALLGGGEPLEHVEETIIGHVAG